MENREKVNICIKVHQNSQRFISMHCSFRLSSLFFLFFLLFFYFLFLLFSQSKQQKKLSYNYFIFTHNIFFFLKAPSLKLNYEIWDFYYVNQGRTKQRETMKRTFSHPRLRNIYCLPFYFWLESLVLRIRPYLLI